MRKLLLALALCASTAAQADIPVAKYMAKPAKLTFPNTNQKHMPWCVAQALQGTTGYAPVIQKGDDMTFMLGVARTTGLVPLGLPLHTINAAVYPDRVEVRGKVPEGFRGLVDTCITASE